MPRIKVKRLTKEQRLAKIETDEEFLAYLEDTAEDFREEIRRVEKQLKKAPPQAGQPLVMHLVSAMSDLIILNCLTLAFMHITSKKPVSSAQFEAEKRQLFGSMAQLMIEVRRLRSPKKEGDSDTMFG